jgi:hypothetical protein
MWHLVMADSAGHCTSVGTFESMTDVQRKVMELEHHRMPSVELEMYVDAALEKIDRAFTFFRYETRHMIYTVKGP